MMSILLVASSLALAPSDRLKMADRMFAKGLYAEAAREYASLDGAKSVSQDDIAFRIAECDRMLGREDAAIERYGKLVLHDIPASMRAVALYRLACAKNDAALFAECERIDPDGKYAPYARLKRAVLLSKSERPEARREATGLFLELAASSNKSVAEEAVYAAATLAYGDRRWKEAAILFARLGKIAPDGARASAARVPYAWSAFLAGRHTECLAVCGDSAEDDFAYLRGAALLALDRKDQGLAELEKYLETHPQGRYRTAAEPPVERAKFSAAVKKGDAAAAVQAARLAAAASGKPSDALRLAWAHENAGAADEARAEYGRIIRKWPDDPAAGEALFANALADMRAGNWGAGDLALEDALKRFPSFPRRNEALYWRGVAAVQLGHEAEGEARLKEALELGLPLDLTREANLLVADADARAGRTAEAAKRYAKQLETGASDRMSAARLASVVRLLAAHGEWKPVIAGARALAARSGDPAYSQTAAALEGRALEALSRSEEAVAAYRRAFAVKADTEEGAAAALALGILEFRRGEYDAAERTLEDAVARNSGPDGTRARARAYRTLADVCRARGEALKAKGYETVLKELFDAE